MSRLLDPSGAAESIQAHYQMLLNEKAFIACVYREYEGLRSLDEALEAAGILTEVQALAAAQEAAEAEANGA